MVSWDAVLFERRVLGWVTCLAGLGLVIWIAALSTPYWIIHIYPQELSEVWSYHGLYKSCVLISEDNLYWECSSDLYSQDFHVKTMARSIFSLSLVAVLLGLASLAFSFYSLQHPKYMYKRVTAVLYTITSCCLLSVLQLSAKQSPQDSKVWYGLSYLLGWSALIALATSGATFLIYSRKRKLLESNDLEYSDRKLSFHPNKS